MIEVTRLNGSTYLLNSDLILTIESTPDTVITLTIGEKLVVKEAPQTLVDRLVAYKRSILAPSVV